MAIKVSSIAVSATLVLALACTGQIEQEAGAPVEVEAVDDEVDTSTVDLTNEVQEPPFVADESTVEPTPLLQAQVEDILNRTCGECHGVAGSSQAGMNYIENLDLLAENGKIVPGVAADSPIVARLRAGTMPPPGYLPPTDDEVEQIAQFIDGWDGPQPPPVEVCDNGFISFDSVFENIQADLFSLDADDRPFTRYLGISNRYNAGLCGDALSTERWAMSKLVNSLSGRARISQPQAIDAEQTLYRIDIRDYGWDRGVQVQGQNFSDGWEAIIAATPYAVEFEGDQADLANDQSETSVPFMYADALLDVASVGDLYYALVEIPGSLDQLLDELQIDVEQDLERGLAVRAGTTSSGVSREDRLVQRHDVGIGGDRVYWQAFEFDGSADSMFLDPLDFRAGGSESIFSLPNGLQAYAIFDDNGTTVAESDILFDTLQDDFRVRTAVSCMTCHARGYLQIRDEVRPFAEDRRFDFSADELEAIRDLYPGAELMDAVIATDRLVYQDALDRAGVPTDVSDPISDTFLRFNADVSLADAAGDLGVPVDLLSRNLNRLDTSLGVLDDEVGVSLDRDVFSRRFVESLCVMQRSSANRPSDDLCSSN